MTKEWAEGRQGTITPDGSNTCKFCGGKFNHTDAAVDVCRVCFYNGRAHADKLPATLTALREVNANAGVWHTGGGCMCIGVNLGEGEDYSASLLITEAYRDDKGAWDYGAELPEEESEDTRWAVGFETQGEIDEMEVAFPLTLDQVCTYVRGAGDAIEFLRQMAKAKANKTETEASYNF